MSGPPPHHFLPGLPNVPPTRSQYGAVPVPNPLGHMQNPLNTQLVNQMPIPLPSQLNPQINNPMAPQMSPLNNPLHSPIPGPSHMLTSLNQAYGIANSPMIHQPQSLQIQQSPMTDFQHHALQHQVLQQQPPTNVTPTPVMHPHGHGHHHHQSKELNTASLCRIGQETVQDIVSRTQEVFQTIKAIQPPNGSSQGSSSSNEKKAKVQELLRTIRVLFKRLRLIYEKCNDNCQLQGMEYTHIESLIPFKDGVDPKHEEKKNTESYRLVCEDSNEIMEEVVLKNRQLKEVIDHLRRIIWEINTMLTMRRC